MPRIELSKRQVSEPFVPRREIPEDTGQAPYKALSQFGEQMQKTAQTVQAVDEALQRAQDTHDKAMLHAEMLRSDAELADQFSNDPDYVNYPDKLSKFQEAKRERMTGLIHNPKLLEELGPTIEAHQLKQAVTIKDQGRKAQKNDIQNNYGSYVMPQFEKAIMDAPNAQTRADLQQQFSDLTEYYIRTGVLTAEQGIKAKTAVTVGADLTRAEQAVIMRPVEFLKKTDEQRKIEYPFLSVDQFMKLDKEAYQQQGVQRVEKDQAERQYQDERAYDALKILTEGGSASQKIAGIKALAKTDPSTGFRGIDAWKALQIIDHLEKGGDGSGSGDNVAYIYAMGAAREGMLTAQEKLKYKAVLSPKQYANVDVTNTTAIKKEKDADFKGLKSQVTYLESTYANDLQGMFPNDKNLRNLLEADFRETASGYLNTGDKETISKLNRRRVNMIDWAKTEGINNAVKQLEKITRTKAYPETNKQGQAPAQAKNLPAGWTEKGGKVYNEKGKPMKWVD
jgi:hypothetical protein